MRALVIGGDGFIGAALVRTLAERQHSVIATTRKHERAGLGEMMLDLSQPIPALPDCDAVFLVAAVNGFQGCEGNAEAYRVNVDAPVEIAMRCARNKSFVVFISSDCVEWCGSTAYARQKASVEMPILMLHGAVVRPARVKPDRVADLCALMIDVAEQRKPGVHRWQ